MRSRKCHTRGMALLLEPDDTMFHELRVHLRAHVYLPLETIPNLRSLDLIV